MRIVALALMALLCLVLVGCSTGTTVSQSSSVAASVAEEPGASDEAADDSTEAQTVQEFVDDAYGAFSAVSKSGKGDSVLKMPADAVGAVIFATHKGSSNFTIETLDEDNASLDLLVNTIGRYRGSTFSSSENGTPRRIKIGADGRWTVRVKPVSSAKVMPGSESGKGDAVLLYDGPAADWKMAHKGKSNFAVQTIGADSGDLPVNDIGNYSGTIPMGAGPMVVIITADGRWSLKTE